MPYSREEVQLLLDNCWICVMKPFVVSVTAVQQCMVAHSIAGHVMAEMPFSEHASLGKIRSLVQAKCEVGKVVKLVSCKGDFLGKDLDDIVIHQACDLSAESVRRLRQQDPEGKDHEDERPHGRKRRKVYALDEKGRML